MNDCVLSLQMSRAVGTAQPIDVYPACARTSSDCAAFAACVGHGRDASYCAAHLGDSCDGDVLLSCDFDSGGPVLSVDCRAIGLGCVTTGSGSTCSDGTRCDAVPNTCDGSSVANCDYMTGYLERYDCDAILPGTTCRVVNNQAVCRLPGAPCTDSRCDGDTLVECESGQETRIDCARLGQHCRPGSGAGSVCVPPPINACSSAFKCATALYSACPNGRDCPGIPLNVCVNQTVQPFDCASIGLTVCDMTAGQCL